MRCVLGDGRLLPVVVGYDRGIAHTPWYVYQGGSKVSQLYSR